MAEMITTGTKTSQSGWVNIEEIESIPDMPFLHTVDLLVTETGASNVCNVLRNLKMLNGYKVRVTVEVLDTPDNRTDAEKLPRPANHWSDAAIRARTEAKRKSDTEIITEKASSRGAPGPGPPIPRGMPTKR